MDPCVIYGPVISFVVDVLKRIPFVAKYPKVVAALLALAVALFPVVGVDKPDLEAVVNCFVVAFGGALGTNEVAKKTAILSDLKRRLGGQ